MSVGVFAACLIISVVACMLAGLAASFATNFHKTSKGIRFHAAAFALDAGLTVFGGVAGRIVSGSWRGSAIVRDAMKKIDWRATGRNVWNNFLIGTPLAVASYCKPKKWS